MRIVIVGAGGIGGYFGARLIDAGADVTFLARENRHAQLRQSGLLLRSPLGGVTLPAKSETSAAKIGTADIVILTCKAFDLTSALEAAAPLAVRDAAVLPLLNGISHLDIISRVWSATRVWGGIVHIGVTLSRNGIIEHLNTLQSIKFGILDGDKDHRCAAVEAFFLNAGVDAEARPNIVQDMWEKLVFVAALAGATCLMRASIGDILQTKAGRTYILGVLAECESIAAAEGFSLRVEALSRYRSELLRPGSESTSSMLRDIEKGLRTEGDHILGDLERRARRHGIETPFLDLAWSHMQCYEVPRKNKIKA